MRPIPLLRAVVSRRAGIPTSVGTALQPSSLRPLVPFPARRKPDESGLPLRFSLSFASTCLFVISCSAPAPTPLNYTVRTVPVTDRSAILDAAEVALIDRGFQVERRDDRVGILTTFPVESMPDDSSLRHTRILRTPNPIRTRAEVRLEPAGPSVRIHCKIVIQEQDTESAKLFIQQRAGADVPRETPIDRDAATTDEQNTYWRTVRRDKAAERELLADILEKSGVPSDSNP